MELKPLQGGNACMINATSFNRTTMELKPIFASANLTENRPFNRTTMELKL